MRRALHWSVLLLVLLGLTVPGAAFQVKPRTNSQPGFPAPNAPGTRLTDTDYDHALFALAAGALSRGSTQTLAAATQIDCRSAAIIPVVGSGGAVTLTSNPQIIAPVDLPAPKLCLLEGTSDTNTVTLTNGAGLVLDTPVTLGLNDLLLIMYTGSTWVGYTQGSAPLTSGTVAAAPACTTGTTGFLYTATDAADDDDCTIGGGASLNICLCDGSDYVDALSGSATPGWNTVMAASNSYSNANDTASAMTITRDSGTACSTEAGIRAYVSAANIPTIEFCDASGNLLSQSFPTYSGQTLAHTIDNGAGTQIACWTLSDAGVWTVSSNESCGTITGSLTVSGTVTAGLPLITKTTATSYTIGTTDARESYGGVIYVTGAATITSQAVAPGMHFTVVTVGNVAVSLDVNAADRMILDGTALADGDKATNTSTTGDVIKCMYESANGFYCASGSNAGTLWTDGN